MLSVGSIRFDIEDRFCASKKGGIAIGGDGWVLAQGSAHMAAALAGYRRRALVSTAGWTISRLVQHEVPAHGSCPGWL